MQAASRYVKRGFRKARGKVIKRYFKKGYRPKIGRMIKDIKKVKSMLNAEKKQLVNTVTGVVVGQCNQNVTGSYAVDITPIIGQGTNDSQRTGDSVKLCSAFMRFQFVEQGAFSGWAKYRITILKVLGAPQVNTTVRSQYYNTDPISTIIDYNSTVNPDFYGQYRKVYERVYSFKSYTTGDTFMASRTIKLRLNHHIRYQTGTNTVADGQYVMLITADNGNCSTSGASTLPNVPTSAINGGMILSYSQTWYYYDN